VIDPDSWAERAAIIAADLPGDARDLSERLAFRQMAGREATAEELAELRRAEGFYCAVCQ